MPLPAILAPLAIKAFEFGFLYVASRMLQKGSYQTSGPDNWRKPVFDLPRTTAGQAIPVVFGTRWVRTAQVVWTGDVQTKEEEDTDTYYLGLHLSICHSPIDSLDEIRARNIVLWDTPATVNATIAIDKPGAFGGLEAEGGVVGDVDLLFGAADQPANAYLTAQLGAVPAFRGLVSVVANGIYLGTTGKFEPWAFLVRRQDAGVATGTAVIGDDINPVRILELAVTDPLWGLGLPASELDTDSWAAAWSTLATESFGLSILWDTSGPVTDLIADVLNHILGVLYTDIETGKLVLKLIRQDYTAADLPLLDEGNLIDIESFNRPSLSELVNTVTVHYFDRDDDPQAITLHNTGLLAQVGGRIVAQDNHYDGVLEAALAEQLAARDLYNLSTPLATLVLRGNRELFSLRLGDPVRVSWDRYGLDEDVFRVTWIDYGSLTEGEIVVHATEDLRGLDTALYGTTPTAWVDPVNDPLASPARLVYEAPYRDLLRLLETDSLDAYDATRGWLRIVAQRPTLDNYGYALTTDDPLHSSGYRYSGSFSFCPVGTLSEAMVPEVETTTVIVAVMDTDSVATTGTYCLLEAELCSVLAYNVNTGAITLRRGILDTVPVAHAAGVRLWLVEDGQWAGYEDRRPSLQTPRYSGDTVLARATTMTSRGALAWADTPEDSLLMAQRFYRAYPPGQFQLNAAYWPAFITGALTIAWAHRDRLLQVSGYTAQDAVGIGPEAGTTYTLKIWDEEDDLIVNASGLSTTSYALSMADEITLSALAAGVRPNETMRVQLYAVRDGLDSWQAHDFVLLECRGYGMFYGDYYGE